MPQLWLTLRFPHLSLECLTTQKQHPVGIHEKQTICMANPAAIAQSIRIGMSTTQARALIPELTCLLRDTQRERAALKTLQEALYSITPHIQLLHLPSQGYGEYAIALEVSGCLELFGGWQSLLHTMHQQLITVAEHFDYCLGAAHSPIAAWLLSWQTAKIPQQPTSQSIQHQLKSLPIEYLLHHNKVIPRLSSMGFNTLEDLWRHVEKPGNTQNYAAIQKRFGKGFTEYLRSIFDPHYTTVRPTFKTSTGFSETIEFDYPLSNTEWLLPRFKHLLQLLSQFLHTHQKNTQVISWDMSDIKHNKHTLTVRTHQPTKQWELLLELSEIQLNQQALPFEVDTLTLHCRQLLANEQPINDLFQEQQLPGEYAELEKLTAKLTARLGENTTHRLSRLDAHLPELTQQKIGALDATAKAAKQNPTLRPTWLFENPIAISQKGTDLYWHGHLRVLQGPERITGEWWNKAEERDYFLAIRDDMIRVWLFHERMQKQWYVQGIFA